MTNFQFFFLVAQVNLVGGWILTPERGKNWLLLFSILWGIAAIACLIKGK